MCVAQTTARILLSGSPLVRAFTVNDIFMFPFPLSLDRIRDTRIKKRGRGDREGTANEEKRRKMDPEGNEDHVTTSRPQEVESNGQEDCWNISIACDFHKIYNNSQTMTTSYIYIYMVH